MSSASVTYSSTRGGQTKLDFRTVVMQGLAKDRGLFVPDEIPKVTSEELESWRSLSFPEMAYEVIAKFVKEDQVPSEKLRDIINRSAAAFRSPDVTPVVSVGGHHILVWANGNGIFYCLIQQCRLAYCCFSTAGTFPWTHVCFQGCGLADAWKLL